MIRHFDNCKCCDLAKWFVNYVAKGPFANILSIVWIIDSREGNVVLSNSTQNDKSMKLNKCDNQICAVILLQFFLLEIHESKVIRVHSSICSNNHHLRFIFILCATTMKKQWTALLKYVCYKLNYACYLFWVILTELVQSLSR